MEEGFYLVFSHTITSNAIFLYCMRNILLHLSSILLTSFIRRLSFFQVHETYSHETNINRSEKNLFKVLSCFAAQYLSTFLIQEKTLWQFVHLILFISIYLKLSKLADCSGGQPEGSLFSSYYTEGRAPLLTLDCFTYTWSIPYNAEHEAKRHQVRFFWVFGMTRPVIELQSPLANTLTIMPMSQLIYGFPYWLKSYNAPRWGSPHGVDCNILVSLNSSHDNMFTFRLISLRKIWTLLFHQLWVE